MNALAIALLDLPWCFISGYDANNRLTQSPGLTYVFDSDGNLGSCSNGSAFTHDLGTHATTMTGGSTLLKTPWIGMVVAMFSLAIACGILIFTYLFYVESLVRSGSSTAPIVVIFAPMYLLFGGGVFWALAYFVGPKLAHLVSE